MRLSVIVFKELGSVRNSIKNAVKPRAAGALPKGMPSVLPQKHANLENAGSVSIKVREQHNIAALMDSLIGNSSVLAAANCGAKTSFGDNVLNVKCDAEGLIPSELDSELKAKWPVKSSMTAYFDMEPTNGAKPQFLYVNTNSMSTERIEELYQVITDHNLVLMESNLSDSPTLRRLDANVGRVLKTNEARGEQLDLIQRLQAAPVANQIHRVRMWNKDRESIQQRNEPQYAQCMSGFP